MNGKKILASGLSVLGIYQAMEFGGMFLTWVLESPWATGAFIVIVGAIVAQAVYKMVD